jgi:hypothetical protein
MAASARPTGSYRVELLCKNQRTFDKSALLEVLGRRCPGFQAPFVHPDCRHWCFTFPDYPVQFAKEPHPHQIIVVWQKEPLDPKLYEIPLKESCWFSEARARVAVCRSVLVVTDQMAASLPRSPRLTLIQGCVAAVLEILPCEAVVWGPSRQVLDPQVFMAQLRGGVPRLFAGGINLRLSHVWVAPGALIMDTMGLAAFGLPEVQCQFRSFRRTTSHRVCLESPSTCLSTAM